MKIGDIEIKPKLPVIVAFVGIMAFGYPSYLVWEQNKVGEAELARAEQNRQIAIQEARAKEESAKSLANAEIIRAQGIAKDGTPYAVKVACTV